MPQEITVYYKSNEPAKGQDILKPFGIFTKNDLFNPEVRDEQDNESKLRKITYAFSLNQHMPTSTDLDDMFQEMVNKYNGLNIRRIHSRDKYNRTHQITVRGEKDE